MPRPANPSNAIISIGNMPTRKIGSSGNSSIESDCLVRIGQLHCGRKWPPYAIKEASIYARISKGRKRCIRRDLEA